MSFYGDLLRDYNNRYSKQFYFGVPLYLKFKTSPSENITLGQSYRLRRSVEEKDSADVVSYATAQGATIKHSFSDKQVASKFKFGNGLDIYEVTYKPKQYNTSDVAVQVKHASKLDTKTNRINNTETLKLGSPNVSGARLWQTLDVSWNTANADRVLKGSTNVNYEKYNVGAKYDYDITKGTVKSVDAQIFVRNSDDYDFFATYNVQLKEAKLGAEYKVCSYGSHGLDVTYDCDGKLKGFLGLPAVINWAGQYRVTDDAFLKFKAALGNELVFGWSWVHSVNKKLKLTFSHNLSVSKVLQGKGRNPYDFGTSLEWKL